MANNPKAIIIEIGGGKPPCVVTIVRVSVHRLYSQDDTWVVNYLPVCISCRLPKYTTLVYSNILLSHHGSSCPP